MNLDTDFPPVLEVRIKPWTESYGGDYYGSLHVAKSIAAYASCPLEFLVGGVMESCLHGCK